MELDKLRKNMYKWSAAEYAMKVVGITIQNGTEHDVTRLSCLPYTATNGRQRNNMLRDTHDRVCISGVLQIIP